MQDGNSAKQPMDLSPMGRAHAMKLIDRYLAGFPYLSLPDPEGYQTALTEVMQRYPQWAGAYAIKQANPDNANLPVSDIVMRRWLESLVQPHRIGAVWDRQSDKQVEERKLIGSDVPPVAKQSYEEFRAEMAARGLPIDRNDPALITETPEEVMGRFGLTQEQWNAIPDGDPRDHWEEICAKHRV